MVYSYFSRYNETPFDMFPFVCELIYCYIAKREEEVLSKDSSKALHLARNSLSGEVEYPLPPNKTGWTPFQIARGAANSFSPDPQARQKRLKMQIALYKTLWDLSSHIKRRRSESIFLLI